MDHILKLMFRVCRLHSHSCYLINSASCLYARGYSVQQFTNRGTTVACHHVLTFVGKYPVCVFQLNNSLSSQLVQKRFKHEIEYPPLIESELEERFIRGSGPGGQKINKTSNCVMLKHLPTGIVVKCQESRSLDTNRARARRHMQERLDWYYNGEQSALAQEKQEMIRKKRVNKKATQQKLAKLKQFKEREGLT